MIVDVLSCVATLQRIPEPHLFYPTQVTMLKDSSFLPSLESISWQDVSEADAKQVKEVLEERN